MSHLIKTEPFTVELRKNAEGIRYYQNGKKFNCGGYEIVNGVAQTPEYLKSLTEVLTQDFPCDQCDKAFKTKAALAAHITRVHK